MSIEEERFITLIDCIREQTNTLRQIRELLMRPLVVVNPAPNFDAGRYVEATLGNDGKTLIPADGTRDGGGTWRGGRWRPDSDPFPPHYEAYYVDDSGNTHPLIVLGVRKGGHIISLRVSKP